MKQRLQKKMQAKLADLARQVLERHQPTIVAVTGSVGKTSTKEAIACVLKNRGARASQGNYNNELGVPLTILGEESPGKNIFGWWSVLRRGRRLAAGGVDYPSILVLEMAADRPGDLAALIAFAPPRITVVTNVSES